MKNKIIYSCLLSLSVFACSLPNQEIKNDKINIKSNLKDKKFKTKSLAIFHHPNRNAEFNADAYQYAFPPPDIAPNTAFNHYQYARDYEYQTRIRHPEYFTALKFIDEGFDDLAYRTAWSDIQAAINNSSIPSAYWHYKNQARANEPTRLTDTVYKNALKSTKVFREEAYFNAYPNIHSTIKYSLDNNFTTANFVNAYEHYILNKTNTFTPLDDPIYQTALNDHIDGFWEDSYLYTFSDILFAVDGDQNTAPILPSGYSHYNPYGRNENRLSNPSYQNAINNVDIHSGQSKAIDFYENSNQIKTFRFHVLPNRKYRFILNEMSEGDAYLKIKDQSGNLVVENDDTYGLDSYVEFNSGNNIDRYTVEVTTSNNGIPSTTPEGRFILTMFHSFKL